jgi:hypothetical protein
MLRIAYRTDPGRRPDLSFCAFLCSPGSVGSHYGLFSASSIKPVFLLLVYASFSWLFIPPLAARYGRVPRPLFEKAGNPVRPLNTLTCFLNRHYVRKPLRELITSTAVGMHRRYSGTCTLYLDAGFPFWNGFPLIPHLSHNDGREIDLAFYYADAISGERVNGEAPTWLGYGICEAPRPGEVNRPLKCEQLGYWQYSLLSRFLSQKKSSLTFDAERTATLVKLLARNKATGKLFIEPHLRIRLGLNAYSKIGIHGCHAVRHDDHLHVQL